MKPQKLLTAAALIACAALAIVGCQPYPPTGPSNTTVNQNVNVNVGQPGASPSPGAGGSVARVGIGKVSGGESCPAGTQPSGLGDSVRIGCTAFLTCSPYSASGQELFDLAIIGAAPEKFDATSGGSLVQITPHASNGYNLDVKGLAKGAVAFTCTVKGVTSPTFTLNVIQ